MTIKQIIVKLEEAIEAEDIFTEIDLLIIELKKEV
jgi:hypothetical protein